MSRPFTAPSQTAGLRAAFSSLRVPEYRILWWGGLFSFLSVQMQFLLRGILAWDLTERESALGLVYLCFGVSMLIATPLGGVASDRLARRTVLIGAQGAITVAATAMGLVVILGVEQYWMLLIAGMVQGGAFGFFGPARVAMASDLVGREQLGNAITLSLLSMNGTRIFAPSIAGVLAGVAVIGIGGAYLISAASSLVSFVYLLRLPKRPAAATSSRHPVKEIADGVRYVAQRPPLRRLVLSSFFVIMFGFNYVSFIPALVEDIFDRGVSYVGILSSASAIGAVLVSIPLAARADSPRAKSAMIISGLVFGLGVMAMGVGPSFWSVFAIVAFVGAATTIYQSLSNTLALSMADGAHQGRVQSLMQLSFAGFGIAALPLGALAEVIGLRSALVAMGAVALASMVIYSMLEQAAADSTDVSVDARDGAPVPTAGR